MITLNEIMFFSVIVLETIRMTLTVVCYIFNLNCQFSLYLKPWRSLNFCQSFLQVCSVTSKAKKFKYLKYCTMEIVFKIYNCAKIIMVLAQFGLIFVRCNSIEINSNNL